MKKLVFVLGLVMALSLVSVASAATPTIAELQAQIAQLTAALAALQGGTAAASDVPTITSTLKVGSTGAQVTALQQYLINEGLLDIAAPTNYFGPKTKAAVKAWQEDNGVVAVGTGVFGPLSIAKLNELKLAGPATPPGTTPGSSALAGTDGNIASVTNLSQYSSEEVGAGQKDIKVLGMEVEASSDGDILLKSMKLNFDPTGNTGSTRLNRYIKSASIWNGSTKIGTANVDDFSKDSSNVYTKTVTLDNGVVIKAKDKAKIYVTVDAASVIDTGDISGDSWTVDVDNIRFADGSGVVTTDTQSNSQNVAIAYVTYSTSADTELKISVSSDSPKAGIVTVSTTADTNNVVLLKGKLTLEGTSDVLLDSFPVTFTSTGTGVATATTNVILKIGDKEWNETVPVATGLSGTVTFDNLDLNIDSGSSVDFTILADINESADTAVSTAFDQGDTLLASVTASNREVMDAENNQGDQLATGEKTGTIVGKAQEFRTSGPVLTLLGTDVSNSAGTSANDDMGTFKIRFSVKAVGDVLYVPSLVAATTTTTGYDGNTVVIVDRAGTATKGGVSVVLTNTSDTTLSDVGSYKIEEDQTENFELSVTAQLPTVGNADQFRAALSGLAWSLTDIYPVTNLYTSNLDPFKTSYQGLN